jgi:hypothetical protein
MEVMDELDYSNGLCSLGAMNADMYAELEGKQLPLILCTILALRASCHILSAGDIFNLNASNCLGSDVI